MTRFQRPTGTLDILPEEQPYWEHVQAHARRLAERMGFERIDAPVFETTDLFARSIGAGTDVVEKEMYTFSDKGGDSLTLRPEFTAGVIRYYTKTVFEVWVAGIGAQAAVCGGGRYDGLAFGERGLKSQLREAGKRGARRVVILGEDELARGIAAVRDMQAGEQIDVPLVELVTWLQAAQ